MDSVLTVSAIAIGCISILRDKHQKSTRLISYRKYSSRIRSMAVKACMTLWHVFVGTGC